MNITTHLLTEDLTALDMTRYLVIVPESAADGAALEDVCKQNSSIEIRVQM